MPGVAQLSDALAVVGEGGGFGLQARGADLGGLGGGRGLGGLLLLEFGAALEVFDLFFAGRRDLVHRGDFGLKGGELRGGDVGGQLLGFSDALLGGGFVGGSCGGCGAFFGFATELGGQVEGGLAFGLPGGEGLFGEVDLLAGEGVDFGVGGGDGEVLACRGGCLGAGLLHRVSKGLLHALGDQCLAGEVVDAGGGFVGHLADFLAQHAPVAGLDRGGGGADGLAEQADTFGSGQGAGTEHEHDLFQTAGHGVKGGHHDLRLADLAGGLEDRVFQPVPA